MVHKRGKCNTTKILQHCIFLVLLLALLIVGTDDAHAQLQVQKDPPGTVRLPKLINPFDGSTYGYYIAIAGVSILVLGILYKNKLLPAADNFIRYMLQFEVSKKTAIVTIVATLVIYVSLVQDFSDPETGDYDNVRSNTEDFVQGAWNHVSSLRVVKYFLLYVSLYGLGNIRVIPLLASITLLVLTYLLTATMAKKRFAGLIAFFALLQSPLFLRFDTTSTYDYGWIAFYLLSLYFALSKKLWYLSPLAFVLSLFSKPLVAVYIPLVMFFIWRADLTRMRRIFLIIPYGLLLTFAVIVASIGSDAIVRIRFDMSLLVAMIYGIPNYLTEDALFWITLLPVCGGLFLLGLKRTYYGQSILLLIGGTLLGYFVLEGFTNISVQQYRFVSLLAASFIGLGMLFSSDRRLEGIPLQRCQKAIPIAILCLTSLPVGLVMSYVLFPSYVTGPINSFAREIATLAGQ